MAEIEIVQLGSVPYADALELQRELQSARLAGEIGDVALLLEHPDVITFGRRTPPSVTSARDALIARGYDVHETNRGGDATYHGPGQLVGYLIVDLAERVRDVHLYLRTLESVVIEAAADLGVSATRSDGCSGVWTSPAHKLASLGVGVRRWVTLHGFALNVSCDLARFDAIVPCGLASIEMVSLSSVLGRTVTMSAARERVTAQLRKAFA